MTVLLTGPTRGLGRALVDVLMTRGPLVLAGRDEVALSKLQAPGVEPLLMDLADLRSVRSAADTIAADVEAGRRPPLTSVIANAGVQLTDRLHRSADGYELTFAVNVLANHLLVRRLLPALTPNAHVVLVGSGTHWGGWRSLGLVAPPRWEDPADLAQAGIGADASTAVAMGDVHGDIQGSYVEVGRVKRSSPASYDRAAEDRLWQIAEELTEVRRSTA